MLRISTKVSFAMFIAIEIVSFILCILLLPMTDRYASRNLISPNYYVTAIYMISLIIVGFILTIIAETYTVVKYFSFKGIATDKSLVRAVLMMNIISYVVLSVLYGQSVIQNILKH